MALPQPLAQGIKTIRDTFGSANALNASLTLSNVKGGLENIAGLIVMTPAVRAEMKMVDERNVALFNHFNSPQGFVESNQREVARDAAQGAVYALEAVLSDAPPSDAARALGLDW